MSVPPLPNKDGQTDMEKQLDWQKHLIDSRLLSISKNPEKVLPIQGLMKELDQIKEE